MTVRSSDRGKFVKSGKYLGTLDFVKFTIIDGKKKYFATINLHGGGSVSLDARRVTVV